MKKEVLMFFVLMLFVFCNSANATTEDYCVEAVVGDISPSSVEIGKNFTVSILIDNCGSDVPEKVVFEITDVSPFISIKESLKKDIGKMGYANSNRFLLYHMEISEDAIPGEYLIKYRVMYGGESYSITKKTNFTVTVIGDEAEPSIASSKTNPTLPYEGDTVELTLRIENTGEGTAKSVEVYVDHPFQGLKQSFIGALDSDEDGPAVLTFIADKSGEFEFPVKISYSDDFGKKEITTNINLIILEKKFNWVGLSLSLLLVAFAVWFASHYFRTKRKKDSIIQQLLEGKPNHEDKKLKKYKK